MKRCPLCDRIWEAEKSYCPWDGHLLKPVENSFSKKTDARDPDKIETQFEYFAEMAFDRESLEKSLSGRSGFNPTETQNLVDVALTALDKKRRRDQEVLLDQVKLFDEFNLRCRTVQYFVDNLTAQSGSFTCKVEYKDEAQSMWVRFTLSIGEEKYRRTFPVNVTYHREPRREVTLEINLYEIGPDKEKRHFRAERAGGKVERALSGFTYLLEAPREVDGVELLKWLESSFKSIFKLAYAVD